MTNHDEVLEALLQYTPNIGQALQSKIDKFFNNKRPVAMTDMKAWATRMRYKFRSIPLKAASEFVVALNINAGRGQPQRVYLQQEGMTRKSNSDQEISSECSFNSLHYMVLSLWRASVIDATTSSKFDVSGIA